MCVTRSRGVSWRAGSASTNAHVLYDRPASAFVPIEQSERERYRQALFARLGVHAETVGFVVCPTSWTEDEDFDVIIEAVVRLEQRIRGWEAEETGGFRTWSCSSPATANAAPSSNGGSRACRPGAIQLRARWLEPEDYPRVVGSADLGLCLHRSSSGLDIPMKVADLFGAGVPVLALDYGACLAERVRHGDNGLLFSTAGQLADILFDLFESYPVDQKRLERLRTGARKSARPTWEEGWTKEARPVVLT